jgi:hypothetical protein
LITVTGENPIKFFGLEMAAEKFFPVAALLLALINIWYCTTHMMAFKVGEIYRCSVKEIGGDKIVYTTHPESEEKFSLSDVLHTLYASHLVRLYPLTERLPQNLNKIVRPTSKIIADLSFNIVPIGGCLFALIRSDLSIFFPGIGCFLQLALYGISCISGGAAFILLLRHFPYHTRLLESDG